MEVRKETTPMAWLFFMPERAGHCDAPAAASENDLHQKVRKISKKTGKMVKKVREMAKNT